MCKPLEYRYAKPKGEREKAANIHIREMIEVLKNQEIKSNLYVKGVKLSNHAFKRMKKHFGVNNLVIATKQAREMLQNAVKIGTVLSYDGRINVLYAYNQTALLLSPDLKTLVTVSKYEDLESRYKGLTDEEKKKLIEEYNDMIRKMEEKESQYMERILSIEQKVREATEQCVGMLTLVKSRGRRYNLKQLIAEQNLQLKAEGRKLFELMIEKRHVCKSLVALQ